MVAIGEGARARVEQAFSAMGTNVLIVSSGAKTSGGAKAGAGSMPTLTWDDLRAIRADVADVRFVAPRVHTTAQVVAEDRNWSTDVTGTTPEFFDIRNWPARLGAVLSPEDVDGGRQERRAGPDRRRPTCSAPAPTRWARPCASPTSRSRWWASRSARGSPRAAATTTTSSTCPVTTFLAKIQGSLQKFIPGTILVEVTSDDVTGRGRRQDRGAAARSPRHRRRRRRRLLNQEPDRDRVAQAGEQRGADPAAGEHRGGVAAGRRHRHHEHHAGQRQRADARDRRAHGGGREAAPRPPAVPGRGAGAGARGRHHRRRWSAS